jgi:hypothetical protein
MALKVRSEVEYKNANVHNLFHLPHSGLLFSTMAPSVNGHGIMPSSHINGDSDKSSIKYPHDYVDWDPSLKPKSYQIKGTDPNSKVLFRDVSILDSTGREPYRGDVYIEGNVTARVGVTGVKC